MRCSERKPQRELLNSRICERSAVQAEAPVVGTVVDRVGVKADGLVYRFGFGGAIGARIGCSKVNAAFGIMKHGLAPSHRRRVLLANPQLMSHLTQFLLYRGRNPFGRITIANTDSGETAYTDVAIEQAHRAVQELVTE